MAYVRKQIRGKRSYYYLVKSERDGKKVNQRVLRYLGTSQPTKEAINQIIKDIKDKHIKR